MRSAKYLMDPAHIEVMRAAFQKLCGALELHHGADDGVTDILVTKMVAIVKTGERCPNRLCERVLRELRP
jgi:hypothetical protein